MQSFKIIPALNRFIIGCFKTLHASGELVRNYGAELDSRMVFWNPFNTDRMKLIPVPVFTDEFRNIDHYRYYDQRWSEPLGRG